jgi:hypothetical protein
MFFIEKNQTQCEILFEAKQVTNEPIGTGKTSRNLQENFSKLGETVVIEKAGEISYDIEFYSDYVSFHIFNKLAKMVRVKHVNSHRRDC